MFFLLNDECNVVLLHVMIIVDATMLLISFQMGHMIGHVTIY